MGASMKLPGWRKRLSVVLRERHGMAFEYGTQDCGLFFAACVKAIADVDMPAEFTGYKTWLGAMRKLRAAGFENHIEYVASLFPEIPPVEAREGDGAVIETTDGFALGIVQGAWVYVADAHGLGLVPRSEMVRAFSI